VGHFPGAASGDGLPLPPQPPDVLTTLTDNADPASVGAGEAVAEMVSCGVVPFVASACHACCTARSDAFEQPSSGCSCELVHSSYFCIHNIAYFVDGLSVSTVGRRAMRTVVLAPGARAGRIVHERE
jgi:hypothetical protein